MSRTHRLILFLLIIAYLLLHLLALTKLPVFADESIYIRWAQLIMDEPWRYLFFPLNDGKTPLLVWLFVPFQYLLPDPLAAGRIVSVLAGLGQIIVTGLLIKKLAGDKLAVITGAILTILLPFWFFYAQMALMDTLLTLWLTLTLYAVIGLDQTKVMGQKIKWMLLGGLCLGLAFWTKLPAVLFIPSLFVFVMSRLKLKSADRLELLAYLSGVSVLGLAGFFLLKIHPAFSQLFSRGGDFLYPFFDLLSWELWRRLPTTAWALIRDLGVMMTWPVLLAPIAGLLTRKRELHLRLLLAWLAFTLPVVLLGKVVYLRYYLPGMIFLTISASFLTSSIYAYFKSLTIIKQAILALVLVQILAMTLVPSMMFVITSVSDPDQLSLPRGEFVQYLGEWSSGHGVKQTIDLLATASRETKIAVATEGYFGTLPDGMLLYLHNMDVTNIWLEGIGQPVGSIPDHFWTFPQDKDADQYWLVVNSHRMKIDNPDLKLIAQFCRPRSAPCLQVWDIGALKPDNLVED